MNTIHYKGNLAKIFMTSVLCSSMTISFPACYCGEVGSESREVGCYIRNANRKFILIFWKTEFIFSWTKIWCFRKTIIFKTRLSLEKQNFPNTLSVFPSRFPIMGTHVRTCVCVAESFYCSPEAVTTLSIGYTPIQNKKFKKMVCKGNTLPPYGRCAVWLVAEGRRMLRTRGDEWEIQHCLPYQ